MTYREARLDDALLAALIALSAEWEAEDSCHGYRTNERSDIEDKRIWLAEDAGEVVGYIFAHERITEKSSSVMPEGTRCFEVDEIFVRADRRSRGIGGELFRLAEQTAIAEGYEFIQLVTATKNARAILHFYIDEVGMEFWSAHLFKKL